MDINEIIEAFDKDALPKDLEKLAEMLTLVEFTGDYSREAGFSGEKHETREMYYTTRVLMVEIAAAIRNQIEQVKFFNA